MDILSSESACFTGHRSLPQSLIPVLRTQIITCVCQLCAQGIVHYYVGGALGFDMLAAVTVENMRAEQPELRLTMALPCRNHTVRWSAWDRELFGRVAERANDVIYVTDGPYTSGCMLRRDRFMVEHSSTCIAWLREGKTTGGTAYTVRQAEALGRTVYRLSPTNGTSALPFC